MGDEMGRVLCKKHGLQAGSLACDHVLIAAEVRDAPKPTLGEFVVDLLTDGTMPLNHYVCATCAQEFHLVEGARLTGDEWQDPARLPYLCPACSRCLEELYNVPRSRPIDSEEE
jgi:hypothetical protein